MTDTRESLGLPWRQTEPQSLICDNVAEELADVYQATPEQRAFIVTACNSHHDLVEALQQIDALDPEVVHIDGVSESAAKGLVMRMGEIARAALHKAKGAPHDQA